MSIVSPPHSPGHDLLGFERLLAPDEQNTLVEFRTALKEIDDSVVQRAWQTSEFPFELIRPLAATGQLGRHLQEGDEPSHLLRGMLTAELARKDASLATFVGVSGSLFGLSVRRFGSAEQRACLLPAIARGEQIGAFALTEPSSGSDIARGMTTIAQRSGKEWVISGQKRWIGNATWSDFAIVWAKDAEDERRLVGFIVPTDTPGWTAEKIQSKYSLRTVQNADITLREVRVPESARLPGVESFSDISEVLKYTRLEVGWTAVGNAIGAFDTALSRAVERTQFGRPLARFQLVQDLLVRAQAGIAASLGVLTQAARLADHGELQEEHASLVKMMAASYARDCVAHCREVLGGDGILLDSRAMKHFMDAEAITTFEGTHQISTLIVGRALTGISAFV